jgi:hypothetical protein
MRSAFLIIIIAGIAVASAACERHKMSPNQKLPDYHIRFFIPLSEPFTIDGKKIESRFKRKWNMDLNVGEAREWEDPVTKTKKYLLANATPHVMLLSGPEPPLSGSIIDETLKLASKSDAQHEASLRAHKAIITLEYLVGPGNTIQGTMFAASVLLTILEDKRALGFRNVSSQSYQTNKSLERFSKSSSLNSEDLFSLLCSFQVVAHDHGYWLHTHGMEQFGAPDIQMLFEDLSAQSSQKAIIAQAALAMIEDGEIMKPGQTFEISGEDAIYDIRSVKADKDMRDHFGAYGAIELSERPKRKR